MIFLSFSLAFSLLDVLHVSWIRNSNFMLLCCQCTHQGEIEKASGQFLVLLLPRFEFKSRKLRWFYPYLSCVENCVCLSWCACDRCDIAGSDEDRGRSRRAGVDDRGWSSTCRVLGG
jgi:hypothetical protein